MPSTLQLMAMTTRVRLGDGASDRMVSDRICAAASVCCLFAAAAAAANDFTTTTMGATAAGEAGEGEAGDGTTAVGEGEEEDDDEDGKEEEQVSLMTVIQTAAIRKTLLMSKGMTESSRQNHKGPTVALTTLVVKTIEMRLIMSIFSTVHRRLS